MFYFPPNKCHYIVVLLLGITVIKRCNSRGVLILILLLYWIVAFRFFKKISFHFSRSKQMWLILSFMEFSKSQPLKIHILLSVPFFTSWQKVPTPAISFIGFITYMSMMKTNGCLTLSKRLKSNTDSNKIWLCENYYTCYVFKNCWHYCCHVYKGGKDTHE